MYTMKFLEGKVVVVTGSGRGIGKETAKLAAAHGASVVLNDVDPEPAFEALEEINRSGGKATAYIGDISEESSAKDIVELAKNAFGRIDALVNNAGITKDSLLIRMETDKWDEVIRVNLRGTFLCTKYAVAEMIRSKTQGAIINITSPSGLIGNIGQINYAAAKSAIIGFTLTLVKEVGRYGIRCNAIAPIAWTRLTQAIPEDILKKKGEQFIQRLKSAKPEHVANLIVFLLSDQAKDINGQIFGIFGEEFYIWSLPTIVFRKSKVGGFSTEDYIDILDEIRANLQKQEGDTL